MHSAEEKVDFTEVKNTYTLNDYRIFNKMLKDIKEHKEVDFSKEMPRFLNHQFIIKN